jgi:hypothetical protein
VREPALAVEQYIFIMNLPCGAQTRQTTIKIHVPYDGTDWLDEPNAFDNLNALKNCTAHATDSEINNIL